MQPALAGLVQCLVDPELPVAERAAAGAERAERSSLAWLRGGALTPSAGLSPPQPGQALDLEPAVRGKGSRFPATVAGRCASRPARP